MQRSLKFPSSRLLVPAAPLLEKEGHIVLLALVADVRRPLRLHRPRAGSAFAADD